VNSLSRLYVEGLLRKSGPTTSSITLTIDNSDTVEVAEGTLAVADTIFHRAEAVLSGNGILDVTGTTGGELAGDFWPGGLNNAGILALVGDISPDVTSALAIELGGTTPGAGGYDQLNLSGSIVLAGTLDVSLIAGFTLTPGHRFAVVVADSIEGAFTTVNLPPPPASTTIDTAYAETPGGPDTLYVAVSAVPQPIAFAGDSAGGLGSGVYSVNPNGTNRTQLLGFLANGVHYPRWAPDNSKIVFTYAPPAPTVLNALFAVSADGADSATVAADTSMRRPRYSRNGTHLAFECGNGNYPTTAQDVCVVGNVPATVSAMRNVGNGGGKTWVTDAISATNDGPGAFAWNPLNDNQLAVVRDTQAFVGGPFTAQIWLVNYDGTGATALTPPIDLSSGEFMRIYSMDWAPGGSFIAFEGVNQSTNERAIFRVELSNGQITQLTAPGTGGWPADYGPVVSPNSAEILFRRDVDGWVLIKVPSTGGTEPLPWMTPAFGIDPQQAGYDWSPDGTEIVHTTDEVASGSTVIAKIKSTTTQATYGTDLVLVGRNGTSFEVQDRQPSWRP
jgi:Tol biopolymer transport system component